MKTTVKINLRNLNALIRKTSFRQSSGMYNLYQFIAIEFDTKKNNTARFYENTQVSASSWTNYPGIKIWENHEESWTKDDVLEACIEGVKRQVDETCFEIYPDINFELIGF